MVLVEGFFRFHWQAVKRMNELSTFLFSRPSFIEGMARVMDLAGALDSYNTSLSPEQADTLALWADWGVVGDDLRAALESVNPRQDSAPADE